MKTLLASLGFLLLLPLLAQEPDETSTKRLIEKLGSANFKERLAAARSLGDRPEAEPALREALRSGSSDAEVQRRISEILDYHERRPLREMGTAAKDGQVERFIEILTALPPGKFEKEGWVAFRDFGKHLARLHENKSGQPLELFDHIRFEDPWHLSADCISEQTKAKGDKLHFLRAGEYEIDYRRLRPVPKPGEATPNRFGWFPVIAARRTVRAWASQGCIIIAGGSVDLFPEPTVSDPLVVVSGGDVTVHSSVYKTLVIARGKVAIVDFNGRGSSFVESSRIISGKSVSYDKKNSRGSIISENDSNPLGFIRWADVPKDKPAPKKK